jgi:hypothetical protein
MPRTNTADITPATYTYEWTDAKQSGLRRTDAEGNAACVPADPLNRDYAEFLSSGQAAADYVAPPAPPEPTTEEKVTRLLSDYGLSRDELRKTLDIAS